MTTKVDEVRRAFLDFFRAADHVEVPSASLQPHDPTLLFTVAGMVPFKPYFVGDEVPPFPRATSSQKCVRAGGKHNDLDDIGRTNRHFSFFEMLGNFSFGDYFKREAITYAWEFVTQHLQLPVERLWVTVHISDDEAAAIWRDVIGVAEERIQRLDEDNFWQMADTGPCGPCSEIFWDLGPAFGDDGGPEHGDPDRFIEIWNLVFMQYEQRADGSRVELPKPSIDTGAGLERLLLAVEGTSSIWDTSLFRPLIAVAESITGVEYGTNPKSDVALRILAEHGRTMTFLIGDGVVPSNEDRGYVLRRIIRRAVLHAYRLGVETAVTPQLVDATVTAMAGAYPELTSQHERIRTAVLREEERFRITLARGLDRLNEQLDAGVLTGSDAFFLHDTLGFPVDLTRELAEERGQQVDIEGFQREMQAQRARAKAAHQANLAVNTQSDEAMRVIAADGPTHFDGREHSSVQDAVVLAILHDGATIDHAAAGMTVDVVLDRTPFYAESGGQIGDTGTLEWEGGRGEVRDTQYAIPGVLIRHRAEIQSGELRVSQRVTATIDSERRAAIRKHHTATHLLHWALRNVLGDHVAQAGSMVGPDRLRFDFSHHEALTVAQREQIEDAVNAEVLTNAPVSHTEMPKSEAEAMGAIAFFGDKYGDQVRVLQAGPHSLELCGGTHVSGLGEIGPVRILTESSIGANTRRIEAVAGRAALQLIRDEERLLRTLEQSVKASREELADKVSKLQTRTKSLEAELAASARERAEAVGRSLVESQQDGVITKRVDGLTPDLARAVVTAARGSLRSGIIAIAGIGATAETATIAVAVTDDLVQQGISAAAIAAPAARVLGGGTARSHEVVAGGGKSPEAVDSAVALLSETATAALATPTSDDR